MQREGRELDHVVGAVREAVRRPSTVVEGEAASDARRRGGQHGLVMERDPFVLAGPPTPCDEDVVAPAAIAVHTRRDAVGVEQVGEDGARELRDPIRVEDVRTAGTRQLRRRRLA